MSFFLQIVGDQWTEEAIDYFEQLTHVAKWKPLQAKIMDYQSTDIGTIPCIELFDTTGSTVGLPPLHGFIFSILIFFIFFLGGGGCDNFNFMLFYVTYSLFLICYLFDFHICNITSKRTNSTASPNYFFSMCCEPHFSFLCLRYEVAGGIMFLGCPSVHTSVRTSRSRDRAV